MPKIKMKDSVVVLNSILALVFLVLTFMVDWLFIVPAFILLVINQKRLMKN